MANVSQSSRLSQESLGSQMTPTNIVWMLLRYVGLALALSFALIVIYTFIDDGNYGFALAVGLVTLMTVVVVLLPRLYPLRWMLPGLVLAGLFVVYPIVFTVQTAFTNYSDGNLFTKQQALDLIEARRYVPDDARQYSWEVMQSDAGDFALLLTRETDAGEREVVFAPADAPIEPIEDAPAEFEEGYTYNGYTLLGRADRTRALTAIQDVVFGEGEDTAGIAGRNAAARPLGQRYVYDGGTDTLVDQQTGEVYVADEVDGYFVPQDGSGDPISPGYIVNIGFNNFSRLLENDRLRGPLLDIFMWTVVFAFLSVFTTFVLGLAMALIMNDARLPGKKVIQSLLIIPYAIPGVISLMIWRGMLNQNLGLITNFIASMLNLQTNPAMLNDPSLAKFSILLVNLWLGYPYMMLIASGALQAIPSDVYEAAAVDGASPRQRFFNITLPLLLVTMGPLLIASYVFNFNNFLIIEVLTGGNPPIPGSPVPAGYTDILISYTYRQAFGSGQGADYGYASAITIVIFLMVAALTMVQNRFTKQWEEVGENV